jgi:replicative DNA helicase
MKTDKLDRLPPHAPESEQGVLGCMLLDPPQTIPLCIDKLRAGSDTFYDLRHQTIYDELLEMYDAREPIDIITLQQRLKDKQTLEQVGGLPYVASLPDMVPSAANLEYYLGIVWDKYLLRRTINVCTGIIGRIYDYEGDVTALMGEVERDILKITGAHVRSKTPPIKELVNKAIDRIEEMHQRKGAVMGIASGFSDLDRMTGGLNGGDMVVIAARPSVGKTSLAMNIAENVAIDNKIPVGIFSLEMTGESLALRSLCSRARVNLRNVRDGFLAERDFPKLTGSAGKLSNAPIYIDDESEISILQLKAKARRMHQQFGIKLFVVDYLQLLHSTSKKADNRQQEISDISGGLKNLAKELKVPIIVLSQLNRELEKDKNRKPRLSDLRESGAIEQDADIVGMLYKVKSKDDDEGDQSSEEAVLVNLLIAKQRNGPTGDCQFVFFKSITRFESAARVSEEDVPQ